MRISDWSSDVCSSDLFFDILDTMVAKCPEVRSNVGDGYWMVTRHEDVRRVGQDWKTFSSAKGYVPNRPADLPYLLPEESDPPRHTAWRRALNPFLSPKYVAQYDGPKIGRATCRERGCKYV